LIETHHLSKLYNRGVYALRDLSLTIDKGEFIFLTGPSGAGKSTLLRLLLREDLPSEGELKVLGRDLKALTRSQVQTFRRNVGFVFQFFHLMPELTGEANVLLAGRVRGARPDAAARGQELIDRLGLRPVADSLPHQLSGGEQQRFAIARALVNDPAVLLADEPTGNLDPEMAQEIMALFQDVNSRGTTVLVATHDRDMIQQMGKRVVTLEKGRVLSG